MLLGMALGGIPIMSNSHIISTTQISHCEAPPCFLTARFLFKSLENDCECEISRHYISSICSCEVRALIKEPASSLSSRFSSPSSFDLLGSSSTYLDAYVPVAWSVWRACGELFSCDRRPSLPQPTQMWMSPSPLFYAIAELILPL